MMESIPAMNWEPVCNVKDLVLGAGVCALFDGEPVALFYLPGTARKVFALSDWDPLGGASVMSRGILGDIDNRLVVASPLYKQHFDLESGICLEDDSVALQTYDVRLANDEVLLATTG